MSLTDNTARLLRQCNELARCIGVEAPIKVMLVDDSPEYCLMFRAMLDHVSGATYLVDVVTDTIAAEAAIRAGRHDLYVIDLNINGNSGIDLIRQIQDTGEHFPFVVLTGAVSDDRVAMGRDCMMWMHKTEYTSPSELDRALRYSLKNWLTRRVDYKNALPPTAVPSLGSITSGGWLFN